MYFYNWNYVARETKPGAVIMLKTVQREDRLTIKEEK